MDGVGLPCLLQWKERREEGRKEMKRKKKYKRKLIQAGTIAQW